MTAFKVNQRKPVVLSIWQHRTPSSTFTPPPPRGGTYVTGDVSMVKLVPKCLPSQELCEIISEVHSFILLVAISILIFATVSTTEF